MTSSPPLYLLDQVDSTNDRAHRGVADGAPHGATWVADHQLEGRGRREIGGQRRVWYSPARTSIYMSLLLRPPIKPAQASGLTLAAALAIGQVLREETGLDVWVKWPNDLYIGDRKVGGILTEAATTGEELSAVIVGVGINVNVSEEQIPEELRGIMTSLGLESGHRWDRLALLFPLRDQILARSHDYCRHGMPAILDGLRALDRTDGRVVSLLQDGARVRGTARGIGERGQLLVELGNSEVVDVMAGEVLFERT